MWSLALVFACSTPDPDALLRAHDLDGASAAWAKAHGSPLDTDHVVADVLSRRSARDPSITARSLAETMEAIRALEGAPRARARQVDHPFERWEDVMAGAAALGQPPMLVAVGRSETPADQDPFTGGALPFSEGRLVGFARRGAGEGPEALIALGRELDADPPTKLVTVVVRTARGEVALFVVREGTGWNAKYSTDPEVAVALMRAAEAAKAAPG
jgi:hypothetical protein